MRGMLQPTLPPVTIPMLITVKNMSLLVFATWVLTQLANTINGKTFEGENFADFKLAVVKFSETVSL